VLVGRGMSQQICLRMGVCDVMVGADVVMTLVRDESVGLRQIGSTSDG
jgi:hypothetical protein